MYSVRLIYTVYTFCKPLRELPSVIHCGKWVPVSHWFPQCNSTSSHGVWVIQTCNPKWTCCLFLSFFHHFRSYHGEKKGVKNMVKHSLKGTSFTSDEQTSVRRRTGSPQRIFCRWFTWPTSWACWSATWQLVWTNELMNSPIENLEDNIYGNIFLD